MSFEPLIYLFILFAIFSFVTSIIRTIKNLKSQGKLNVRSTATPKPIEVDDINTERIQKERNELRFGFPTPRPQPEWIDSSQITETYQKKDIHEKPTPALSHIDSISPEAESTLDTILKGEDPITQGIIMSQILSPPQSLKNFRRKYN
ncbi:MAG: hypothetical protein P9M13_10900 [Candidatus Ancaeobacter aquaticus]|nr:hypothetical protein [Candidatus Ancaeobacter aquaticus]